MSSTLDTKFAADEIRRPASRKATQSSLPFFEANDRVLLATLPTAPVPTLYARLGDAPALVYATVLVAAVAAAFGRRGGRATAAR